MGGIYSCKIDMENKDADSGKTDDVYHERQIKEMCALHALNNLFQDKQAFSKKDLDDICVGLSPGNFINPHRSFLGLGNYDVNVIMAAVQQKFCETVWFDKRKDINCLIPSNILGFILNTPTDYKWGVLRLPFKRKHWIAIRKINGLYYNLDSKLESPEVIGEEDTLLGYLQTELSNGDKELLLVVKQDIEQLGSWRKESVISNQDMCNSEENQVKQEKPTSKPNLQTMEDL